LFLENVESAAVARQPMFHTGTSRSVLVSKSSVDKARTVLEGQVVANEGLFILIPNKNSISRSAEYFAE
jgi:hypothetical protein